MDLKKRRTREVGGYPHLAPTRIHFKWKVSRAVGEITVVSSTLVEFICIGKKREIINSDL